MSSKSLTNRLCFAVAFVTVASATSIPAQVAVEGTVVDGTTGAPLVGARVALDQGIIRDFTDEAGQFLLEQVEPGWHSVSVAALGYEPLHRDSLLVEDGMVAPVFRLTAQVVRLSEIRVSPGSFGIERGDLQAPVTLERDVIAATPQLADDLYRTFRSIPGVNGDDISARPWVRGGAPDDLKVTLNGLELHEPYHLKDFDGALSVIDVRTVEEMSLSAGGMSAASGDRIVGELAMTTVSPLTPGPRSSVGLSLANASLTHRRSFADDRGGWYFAGRRGYLDILLAMTDNDSDLSPGYFDVFNQFTYEVAPDQTLSANLLYAGDNLGFADDELRLDSKWTNTYAWMNWDSRWSRAVSSRTLVSYSRLTRRRDGSDFSRDGTQILAVDDNQDFDFFEMRSEWDVELNGRNVVSLGAGAILQQADYDYRNWDRNFLVDSTGDAIEIYDTTTVVSSVNGSELGGFVSYRTRPHDRVVFELGARLDRYSHTDDLLLSPRASFSLDLDRQTTVRFSAGRYVQSHGVHQLQAVYGETEYSPAEKANLLAAGVSREFASGLRLRVEAYYRRLLNPRPRYISLDRSLEAFPEVEGDVALIMPDKGRARGLEFVLQGAPSETSSWSLNYVLAEAVDGFGDAWAPRFYDQRHTVSGTFTYRPSGRWELTARGVAHSGWAVTPQTFVLDTLATGDLVVLGSFGAYASERLPAYHRVDFRASRTFSLSGGKVLSIYLDVFNLINRRNPRGWDYLRRVGPGGLTVERVPDELLGILPTLGARLDF